jgi:membrane protein insertase Oxa1/YidC/SpoIIIJ
MSTSPVAAITSLLTSIHNMSSPAIPYWIVIVATTLTLRTMLLPLAVIQAERVKRMKKIQPLVSAWEKSMRNEAAMVGRRTYHKEVLFQVYNC